MKRKNCKNSGKRWKAKRVLTLCMTALLLVSSVGSAYAAEKQVNATNSVVAEASSMRLQKKEGTVILTNKEGKPLSAMNNMRIYDGYKIGTEQKSYGWIALDDTKLVKEDAASSLRVQQDGKKLDVYLESGSLFFNISKPLEQDETFTVHTSTMAMGCRGTSGQIQVIDPKHTQIVLTDGTVVCETSEQAEGGARVETITAGSVADIYIGDVLKEGETKKEQATVTIRKATVEDLRGFSATEILGDQQLQERVAKGSGLDLSSLNEYAPARLQKDEKIVWEDSSYSSDDSSDSSGVTNESTEEKTEEEEDLTSTTLPASATVAEIQAALDKFETVNIQNDGSATAVMIDSALDVAEGKTLNIDPALPVNVTGNSTNLTVDGTLTAGTINNGGTINNNSANSIHVKGEFINQGTFHNGESGVLYFEGSSTVLKNSGTVEMAGGEIKGGLENTGNVDLKGGKISGNFDNTGYVKMSGGQINGNVKHTGSRGSLGLDGGVIVGNITAPGGILSMGDVELQGSLNLNGKFLGLTSCVITGNINVTDAELTIAENAYIKGQITLNSGKLEMYGGTVDNGSNTALSFKNNAEAAIDGGVVIGGIQTDYPQEEKETEKPKIVLDLENAYLIAADSVDQLRYGTSNSIIKGGSVAFKEETREETREEDITYRYWGSQPEGYIIYRETDKGSILSKPFGKTISDELLDNDIVRLEADLNFVEGQGAWLRGNGKIKLDLNSHSVEMVNNGLNFETPSAEVCNGIINSSGLIKVTGDLKLDNVQITVGITNGENGNGLFFELANRSDMYSLVEGTNETEEDEQELENDLNNLSLASETVVREKELDKINGLVLVDTTISGYGKPALLRFNRPLPDITATGNVVIANKFCTQTGNDGANGGGSVISVSNDYANLGEALDLFWGLKDQIKMTFMRYADGSDYRFIAGGYPKVSNYTDTLIGDNIYELGRNDVSRTAARRSAPVRTQTSDNNEGDADNVTNEEKPETPTIPETQVEQEKEPQAGDPVVPETPTEDKGDTPDPEDLNETDNLQNPPLPEETIAQESQKKSPVQSTVTPDPESTVPQVPQEPTEETPDEETPDPENS